MSNPKQWDRQSYLEGLRPEPDCSVRMAIVAGYSADLTSIGAALLALAGLDNDSGSGSKADLAEAIERLRGRVRFLIQRGRLARPKRLPLIAGILDQFLQEIPFDERECSWHPKISLARFQEANGESTWRLWLGSRNLTQAENRDFGLLLTSQSQANGPDTSSIPSVGELARRLAVHAQLEGIDPKRLKDEVEDVRWIHPARMHIEDIQLTSGKGTDEFPRPPSDIIEELIAVSPFLDGAIVGELGRWGGNKTKRTLISTLPELTKIAGQASDPLGGFGDRVLTLDAPAPEPVEAGTNILDDEIQPARGEAAVQEELRLGLHAKIIAARMGKTFTMIVGSANATQRAWTGTNVEVIATITAHLGVREGLLELVGQARPVSAELLKQGAAQDVDKISERLDLARKEIVGNWTGKLLREEDRLTVSCESAPHPTDTDIAFEAGLATGALLPWRRGSSQLELGTYAKSLQTELMQFRISLGGANSVWMQRVPMTPPMEAGRDHAALSRHLGPQAFLAWIAALLEGSATSSDTEDLWDRPPSSPDQKQTPWLGSDLLSVEGMLSCWARDPAAFLRTDSRLKKYLNPIITQAEEDRLSDLDRLREFKSVWETVSAELSKDH